MSDDEYTEKKGLIQWIKRHTLYSTKFWLFGALTGSYLLREQYINSHLKSFQNETVLITGGSTGIGLLIAKKFAREGAGHIVLWARDESKLNEAKIEIQREFPRLPVSIYSVDVGDRDMVYTCADRVRTEVGSIGVLVNNAGVVSGKPFDQQTDDDAERILKVNTLSNFYTARAFLPDMMARRKGHIITVASVAGMIGVGRMTDYSTSKFGQFAFSESLRAELRSVGPHTSNSSDPSKGVQVLCVCPYYIDTGMFKNVQNNNVPWLLPILKPDYVAEQTVLAAKRGDQLLVMPYFCWSIFLVRALLPGRLFDTLMYDIMGVQKTIQEFDQTKTGRSSIHASVEDHVDSGTQQNVSQMLRGSRSLAAPTTTSTPRLTSRM